jgi:hypothetical protein
MRPRSAADLNLGELHSGGRPAGTLRKPLVQDRTRASGTKMIIFERIPKKHTVIEAEHTRLHEILHHCEEPARSRPAVGTCL